jgi:hypothetical protein
MMKPALASFSSDGLTNAAGVSRPPRPIVQLQ